MVVIVGVIGDSDASEGEYKFAEELGRALASKGYVIINGGRTGVMEAVSKGAKSVGGLTIGIMPTPNKDDVNKYIDIPIFTTLGWARNSIVPLSADVVIAIGGKAGTLSEIAYAWMYGKPIIAVVGFGGWSEKLAGEKIDDRRDDYIIPAKTVDEIMQILDKLIRNAEKR